MKKIFLFFIICILIIPTISNAAELRTKMSGKLLLQVEQGGRIWYVAPKDTKRYEVTFTNALELFEEHALGISNTNLNKIAIEPNSLSNERDSDKDGFKDQDEARKGFDPFGSGKMPSDTAFGKKFSGKLLLQVEQGGRIWYVDFSGKRWEVTWENLMTLFKKLAVGITNKDLSKIPTIEDTYAEPINNQTNATVTNPTYSTNTPIQQNTTTSQKPALLQILQDFDMLSGAQLAQLYVSLSPQDLWWIQMKDAFGNILHFKICQEVPNFIHQSLTYGQRTCLNTINGYRETFALGGTMDTVLNYADRQRLEILNTYNCGSGTTDSGTCSMYKNATQNVNNMMSETNRQIINNIGQKCYVNIDPDCQPYTAF